MIHKPRKNKKPAHPRLYRKIQDRDHCYFLCPNLTIISHSYPMIGECKTFESTLKIGDKGWKRCDACKEKPFIKDGVKL